MRRFLLALVGLLLIAARAGAHESLPVFLGIVEQGPGAYAVTWRIPATQGAPPSVSPSFPAQCAAAASPSMTEEPGALVGRMLIRCGAAGLSEGSIVLAGLDHTVLDALVRISFADGRSVTRVLHPSEPSLALDEIGQHVDVAGYFSLGVEHILFGIDHLLFVTGLLLIVRRAMALAKTITAFTIAHSITLALAALGYVHVPPPPVEATIALSIVFLARELARLARGEAALTARYPWVVAFTFGLLHGLGFAGALAEVGLPPHDIPLALLLFNLGVEAGQLLFVAALLLIRWGIRRLMPRIPPLLAELPTYGIGTAAAFWLINRVILIL